MLEKFFKLKENKTSVMVELLAGIATFMSMSYIIFVNPAILSNTGMDYNAVYVATILASAIGTIFLGLVANVPYVQSAGLGLNALFTYTICGTMGFTWQQALAMVFICGVINVLITLTSIRKKIIKSNSSYCNKRKSCLPWWCFRWSKLRNRRQFKKYCTRRSLFYTCI